jgi:hypothetical protein
MFCVNNAELNKTVELVEKTMITRTKGNRKVFIIPRTEREPQTNIEIAIYQVARYPKLKYFFPELSENMDISRNNPISSVPNSVYLFQEKA